MREENDFAVTDGFVDAIDDSTDAVFLCQPNNPTGQVTPLVMVQKLLRRCADCGAVLVVDECFLDFLAARDTLTAKTVLRDAPNLIILKAFTKLYAMAGVRLGYALCSDAALLDKMRAAGQPWAVSGLAQAAGLAADLDCFIFDVYGYGHGCGMSQWGAIGYARNGWGYQDILTHYFVGTTITTY